MRWVKNPCFISSMLGSVFRRHGPRTAPRTTPASCLSHLSLLFDDTRMPYMLASPTVSPTTRLRGAARLPFPPPFEHCPCQVARQPRLAGLQVAGTA